MPRIIHRLTVLYRLLLRLYPADLRREYGAEMTAVYAQLLCDAFAAGGTRALAATVLRAISEIFTVAIPAHLTSPWAIATGLSLVITSAVLGSLVRLMMFIGPHP